MIYQNLTRFALPGLLLAAVALQCAGVAHASTDEEAFREFQFDFRNAGAWSLGMGGVGLALATDATALQTNPAALHGISGTQFVVELRAVDDDARIATASNGSLDVEPLTGARDLPFLGLTSVSNPDRATLPGFLGVSWSTEFAARTLVVAASRQVVLSRDRSFATDSDSTQVRFSFDSFPNTVAPGGGVEAYAVDTTVLGDSSADIIYWNYGASFDVNPDFSVGATLSLATLDLAMRTATEVADPQALFLDPVHPRLPASPGSDIFETRIDDSDDDLAWSLGIHWHPDSVFRGGRSSWQFGASFRKGASFEVDESTLLNGDALETFANGIVIPDRFGVGASYSPHERWTVAAEIERIEYSQLLDGFRSGVNFLTSERITAATFGLDPDAEVRFAADDGSLFRIGVQYVRPPSGESGRRLTLRGGYFRTPDDRVRMVEFNSDDADVNATYLRALGGGESENHFTAGIGYGFGRSTVQLAGEIGDDGTQIVGSYSFTLNGAGR